jgi:LacI family transcriptional regulator
VAKIDDVAKIAGVSPATVSRVINGVPTVKLSTKQKVKKALAQLSYRPSPAARALARAKNSSLGLVLATFSEPFFMSVADSIGKVCKERKVNLVTGIGGNTPDSEEKAIDTLRGHGCSAIVLHSKYLSDERLVEFLELIPGLVLLNRMVKGYEARCVWLDNLSGARRMVDRLVAYGHQRFAFINRAENIDDARDRLAGWKFALQQHEISFDESSLAQADCTTVGGYQAAIELLDKGAHFTAMVCYDDSMALGALRALADRGIRVPLDVSVIGFNDSYMARASLPKLTTMHYPVEQMASEAGLLALNLRQKHEVSFQPIGMYQPVVIARQTDTYAQLGAL